ncbi:hemolymph lipopolysaccharide-binding protein-like [Hetaerina americana]|uniref:hemolymph lipopolysaccharide-binding protein-like n=1 Tax=Hetaerina americana TaxID=62018 RepID=UPI003A7F1755
MNLQKLDAAVILYYFLLQTPIIFRQSFADARVNKSLHITFLTRKNQTGHHVTKWAINEDSSKLPDGIAIDLKSSITEQGGVISFHLGGILTVPPNLPAGYEYFPGIGYYKFYTDGVNSFSDASSKCMKDGAHLAIINSEAEAGVLVSLFLRNPKAKDYAFIGFHDMHEEGKYVTVFGDPLEMTSYTKWAAGEPSKTEDCGSLHRSGGLNDIHCNQQELWPFICEYDLSWNEF